MTSYKQDRRRKLKLQFSAAVLFIIRNFSMTVFIYQYLFLKTQIFVSLIIGAEAARKKAFLFGGKMI